MKHLLEWKEYFFETPLVEVNSEMITLVNIKKLIEHALKPYIKAIKSFKGVSNVEDFNTKDDTGIMFDFKEQKYFMYYTIDNERIYLEGENLHKVELTKVDDIKKYLN